MERSQANARIQTSLNTLRISGWTTEQREYLVNGLTLEDAVEAADRAVHYLHDLEQSVPFNHNLTR